MDFKLCKESDLVIDGSIHMENTHEVKRSKSGKIIIKNWNKSQLVMTTTLWILTLLTIYGFLTFDYKDIQFWEAIKSTLENLKVMFFEAKLSHFSFSEAIYQVGVTLALAFLSTIIGAVISIILGLLAANNLSTKTTSNVVKYIVAFIRAVPTVLWVLIFAISAGLGSVAAVIGMMLHSIAYLVKAYSEAFEEVDEGVIEALKACGANWFHIVTKAVLPSTITYLLSWTFLRFEINFSVAVAMGAAAGAGGIGFELFMASGFYFDLREVGFITYAVLIIAIILEIFSTKMKNRYLA
jgi:phosphonate transport system permease protein